MVLHFKTCEVTGLSKMCADMVLPLCWFALNKKYVDVTEAGRVVIRQMM